MNWYIAKIVFRIFTESKRETIQFDEQLRLIMASSKEEAILKARVIGLSEEDCFLNNRRQSVAWEFVNILDVQLLANLKDGIELYSNISEHHKSEDYIRYVHLRAAHLQNESSFISA